MKNKQTGYTIIELLVVITVIGVLAGLVFVGLPNSQARGRDGERVADIDTVRSRLEEYFTDHGAYPNTLNTTLFPGLDAEALKDPSGDSISISLPVSSQAAAQSSTNPNGSGADYTYVPYPISCNLNCTGYILKSYIEMPNNKTPNPYVRGGTHNN